MLTQQFGTFYGSDDVNPNKSAGPFFRSNHRLSSLRSLLLAHPRGGDYDWPRRLLCDLVNLI